MKVGDAVQNLETKESGLVVEKNRPATKQKPFLYVLDSKGQLVRWYHHDCEVINELW